MNLELNVVRFENEDVIVTSHEECVTLTFTTDNTAGGQENIHYHVSGATLTTANKIKVGEHTYDLAVSSKTGHNSDPCIVNGASWNVYNDADYADFATALTGHYVLDTDGITYVKE